MKHITRLAIACTFLFAACSDNKDLLINHYKPKTLGNLQIGICGHIEAFMTGSEEAFIYTGDNNFFTEDNFKTFSGFTGTDLGAIYCNYELSYYDAENMLIYNLDDHHNEQYQINLLEISDFGKRVTSRSYDRYQFNDFETFSGDRFLSKPFFFNRNDAIVASYSYDLNEKLDFFMIRESGIDYLSSIMGDYYPVKYKFDGVNGYILMADFASESAPVGTKFYFSTTVNGTDWTTPVPITSTQKLSDFDMHGSTIMVYGDDAAFTSVDKGNTWEPIDITFSKGLTSVDVVTEEVAYLAVVFNVDAFGNISQVYKTVDGGSAWDEMDKMVYAGKLTFYDKDHGLASFKDILQVTHDGAKTWEPVIFPVSP